MSDDLHFAKLFSFEDTRGILDSVHIFTRSYTSNTANIELIAKLVMKMSLMSICFACLPSNPRYN